MEVARSDPDECTVAGVVIAPGPHGLGQSGESAACHDGLARACRRLEDDAAPSRIFLDLIYQFFGQVSDSTVLVVEFFHAWLSLVSLRAGSTLS